MTNETGDRAKRTMATRPAMVFMRILLFVFDIIFWASGIAVLAVGIWSRIQLATFMQMSGPETDIVCWTLIGAGVFIILISVLGFYATISSKPWLLKLYGFLLIVLFLGELGAGIFGYIRRGTMKSSFQDGLATSLDKYGEDSKVTDNVDDLQETIECCGVTNYTDWFGTPYAESTGVYDSVPTSCCVGGAEATGCVTQNLKTALNLTIYTEGCYAKVIDIIDSDMAIIGGSAVGVIVFQIIGIILSCCLATSINKNTYEVV